MHILRLDGVALQYAGREVFRDLSWAIGERERIGLIGPNGSGKSSLLKILAGELDPDAGSTHRARGVTVGSLPQDVSAAPGRTVIEEAGLPPPRLAEVMAELERIERRLGDPDVCADERRLARALDQQSEALDRFERLGGPRHEGRVREMLDRLGLSPADHSLPLNALSGGQRKLVAVARLAIESPDLLLLDEPDNHLDLESKRSLEAFIRSYPGAVVIVSHDRYLLDETVRTIAELEDGRLTLFAGDYTSYASERELKRLRQQRTWVSQQKEIARIEASIQRFELWASMVVNERHIKQARSRRKMLERMEASGELVDQVRERRRMRLTLEGSRGSTRALSLEGVSMAFGGDPVFLELDLLIRHGERVGLIGPNGAGKSVLFKLVLGQLDPVEGRVRIGPGCRVGYYAQEHETLEPWLERTPIELARHTAPLAEGEAVSFLLKFLFRYEQLRQRIGTMSGGERSRLQLACLMLQKPNLLLLDEPTNNLDIPSAEVLEAALEDFEGAVVVISHDRYLLDRLADRVVELSDGELDSWPGGYSDWLEHREARKRP